jgi:hypothetical protein
VARHSSSDTTVEVTSVGFRSECLCERNTPRGGHHRGREKAGPAEWQSNHFEKAQIFDAAVRIEVQIGGVLLDRSMLSREARISLRIRLEASEHLVGRNGDARREAVALGVDNGHQHQATAIDIPDARANFSPYPSIERLA